jgi:hypothetical protein
VHTTYRAEVLRTHKTKPCFFSSTLSPVLLFTKGSPE